MPLLKLNSVEKLAPESPAVATPAVPPFSSLGIGREPTGKGDRVVVSMPARALVVEAVESVGEPAWRL